MTSNPRTLPEVLLARATTHPDHACLNIDGHVKLSYGEWSRKATAVARGILRLGGAPGVRFALLFDGLDWVGYAVAYLAVLRCGGTAVHLNGRIPATEIQRRLTECGVSWIIRSPFLSAPQGFSGTQRTVDELFEDDGAPISIAVAPESIADVRYTSGTTGPAKAYLVSHANLTFGRILDAMSDLSKSATMLAPMRLGTPTSATVVAVALTSPAKIVVCSPIDVERMASLVESERIDSLMITPHIATQIVEARLAERYDLSSVRIIACSSAPLAPALAHQLLALIPGATIQIAYAQSEAHPALLVHTFDAARPLSVGKASPLTELMLVDANGTQVPNGELGEIWLRSPAPKRLFLNAPEINARLLADGWHRTGDMGRIDGAGQLELFDRAVDVLARGTRRLSSIALEAILLEHSTVREAAVVGIPRDDGTEDLVAFVVLRDPSLLSEVEAEFRLRVPPDHVLDGFKAVASLPRTHNGKVLKRELRLEFGGSHAPARATPRVVKMTGWVEPARSISNDGL